MLLKLKRPSSGGRAVINAGAIVPQHHRRYRTTSSKALYAILVLLVSAFCLPQASDIGPAAASAALGGPRIIGWGFNSPSAVSSDGTHVWVANFNGHSVTELDAATGALVQVISGPSYRFDLPTAISSDSADVWVANPDEQSITGFPT